jgi:hypothetical protein
MKKGNKVYVGTHFLTKLEVPRNQISAPSLVVNYFCKEKGLILVD